MSSHSPASFSSSNAHGTLDHGSQRRVLLAMITGLVAVVAAMSGLNVAQQNMAVELGASQGGVLWIINSYTLVLAALLMPAGAIGDRWGRKSILLAGLAIFGTSTIAAIFADTVSAMIVARAGAGVGAAMIMPSTLSIITSSFPVEDRGRGIGVWAGFAGAGGMIGLFASSVMIDVLSWRWVFALPLVLVVISLHLSYRSAPNSREVKEHPFDVLGSVLAALVIGGLVLGVHEGPEKGWTHWLTLTGLIVGGASAVLFVLWERHHPDPLLDISAFADRGLAAGTVTMLIMFGVMFGIFVVLFPFFQAVLGWSALRSATAMLPMALAMLPLSTVSPLLAQRYGKRPVMLTGVSLFALGLVIMALTASVERGYWSVLPGLLLIGTGMGLTMTPSTEVITETLPEDKQGVASAINDTSRELGGAVGVALLGSVLSAGYRSAIEPALVSVPQDLAESAAEGIGSAFVAAAQAGPSAPVIVDAAKHAFIDGWVGSMWLGVGMAMVALVFLIVRGPKAGTVSVDSDDRALVDA